MSHQKVRTPPNSPCATFSARVMDAENGEAIYLTNVPCQTVSVDSSLPF
jgi:hypothetical protein